jgi:hypothetical protein
MDSLWLKIKVWTKITLFAILTIAVLVFLFENVNKPVNVWLWNDIPTTLLKVLMFTVLISVIFTIMLGTTFRTVRQVKEIRARSRAEKMEREVAEMKVKASMLQTRMSGPAEEISPVMPAEDQDRP